MLSLAIPFYWKVHWCEEPGCPFLVTACPQSQRAISPRSEVHYSQQHFQNGERKYLMDPEMQFSSNHCCYFAFCPEGLLQLGISGMHHLKFTSVLYLGVVQIFSVLFSLFDSFRCWCGWAFSESLVELFLFRKNKKYLGQIFPTVPRTI